MFDLAKTNNFRYIFIFMIRILIQVQRTFVIKSDEPDPCDVKCWYNGDNDDYDDLIGGVNPSAIHFLEKTM